MDPVDQTKLQAVADDIGEDISTVKAALAAYKSGGLSGLTALAPHIVDDVKKDIADVEAALPVIKAGYQTTEFWLIAGGVIVPVLFAQFMGKPIPFDVVGALSGVAAVYAAVRGVVKKPVA